MNTNILISAVGLFAVVFLVAVYIRTFGLTGPTYSGAINADMDSTGRSLRQRLDQSEASSSWNGIIY